MDLQTYEMVTNIVLFPEKTRLEISTKVFRFVANFLWKKDKFFYFKVTTYLLNDPVKQHSGKS